MVDVFVGRHILSTVRPGQVFGGDASCLAAQTTRLFLPRAPRVETSFEQTDARTCAITSVLGLTACTAYQRRDSTLHGKGPRSTERWEMDVDVQSTKSCVVRSRAQRQDRHNTRPCPPVHLKLPLIGGDAGTFKGRICVRLRPYIPCFMNSRNTGIELLFSG